MDSADLLGLVDSTAIFCPAGSAAVGSANVCWFVDSSELLHLWEELR